MRKLVRKRPLILLVLFMLLLLPKFLVGASSSSSSSTSSGCDAPTLFQTNIGWVSINSLVVLFSVALAGVIYSLGGILPPERAERLRRISRYEMFEALVSVIIIIALFGLATTSCNVGAYLGGQQSYTDLFRLDDLYLGNLLFTNGVSLVSQLYQTSVNYVIASNTIIPLEQIATRFVGAVGGAALGLGKLVSVEPGVSIELILQNYANVVTGAYAGFVLIAFAPLLLLFLLLPVFRAASLTIVVPAALLVRSVSFIGPKVREASNLFIAIAIGFYFVLPLMIAFNAELSNCLGLTLTSALKLPACTSYAPWTYYLHNYHYKLPVQSTSLFSPQGQSLIINSGNMPYLSNSFNLMDAYGLNIFSNPKSVISNVFNTVFGAPKDATDEGNLVASYLFLGLVMTGLDLAVVAGFINGLGKGLNSIYEVFGLQPFWGD